MKKLIIAIAVFGLLVGHVFAKMPDYKGFVNDFADVLSPQEEMQIEQRLTDYEKKTTNEIAVVTVKTTQPDSIEQYTINLADQWKPGKVGKDNGVIMLFAMDDRKMRIEVGRGLEGNLTDIETKHIQDDIIRPEFKSNSYSTGINKGLDAIIVDLSPEEAATIAATSTTDNASGVGLVLGVLFLGGLLLALSPHTPLGGEGDGRIRGLWVPKKGSKWGKRSVGVIEDEHYIPVPFIPSSRISIDDNDSSSSSSSSSNDDDDDSSSSSGGSTFGGGGMTFGGGSFSGGGSSSSW